MLVNVKTRFPDSNGFENPFKFGTFNRISGSESTGKELNYVAVTIVTYNSRDKNSFMKKAKLNCLFKNHFNHAWKYDAFMLKNMPENFPLLTNDFFSPWTVISDVVNINFK